MDLLTDVACCLFLIVTAAFVARGLVALVHDFSRISSGPWGKRWWFWLGAILTTLAAFASIIFHLLHGAFWLMQIVWELVS